MTHVLSVAEFTEDMAETLHHYFSSYAKDGIVKVEVTDRGLWLVLPGMPMRHFLGRARLPDSPPKVIVSPTHSAPPTQN